MRHLTELLEELYDRTDWNDRRQTLVYECLIQIDDELRHLAPQPADAGTGEDIPR